MLEWLPSLKSIQTLVTVNSPKLLSLLEGLRSSRSLCLNYMVVSGSMGLTIWSICCVYLSLNSTMQFWQGIAENLDPFRRGCNISLQLENCICKIAMNWVGSADKKIDSYSRGYTWWGIEKWLGNVDDVFFFFIFNDLGSMMKYSSIMKAMRWYLGSLLLLHLWIVLNSLIFTNFNIYHKKEVNYTLHPLSLGALRLCTPYFNFWDITPINF